MTTQPLSAPFPYFGGKRRGAPIIWQTLGDPGGYIEPFAGSAAVLLARPPFKGKRVETLNDADGWLINTWRAIQLSPDKVAEYATCPFSEIDYHARLAWLQGHPEAHDARAAGWWLTVMACALGGAAAGDGPWHVIDGRLRRTGGPGGITRAIPHLGPARGVYRGDLYTPDSDDIGGVPPNLKKYIRRLSARLLQVRITCGDWARVTTPSAYQAGTGGDGSHALLLDPPYTTSGDLYHHAGDGISDAVRAWCLTAPRDLRIVLCGYDGEHDALLAHGWTRLQGKAGSGSGYSKRADNGQREKLWISPACIRDRDLFTIDTDEAG